MVDGSEKHPSTNAIDAAYAKHSELMGFASITTISKKTALQGKKCCNKGKSKNGAGVAAVSTGVEVQSYTPMQLLLSREAHIKVIAVSLEVASAILPLPLCADPMLPLVATLDIFKLQYIASL